MAIGRRPTPAGAASLRPMLASVGSGVAEGDLLHGSRWVFEPKYDGIRVLGYATREGAALVTRNGLEKTRQFPEISEALVDLAKRGRRSYVIDGEIVALDPESDEPARFQQLQSRMHVVNPLAIAVHRQDRPAAIVLFDLLLDGDRSLLHEPLSERRARLEALHARNRSPVLRLSEQSADGKRMLDRARRAGWEGIMAKDAESVYQPGVRTRDWLKLKLEKRQELVVGGYTEPRNSREHIGAILLGYYDQDGKLIYAGHTGGGFSRASLADMYKRLSPLERKTSAFTPTPRTNERAHWVTPSVVAEVRFNEWTADGKLRQPVFLGVRDDKAARDVVREEGRGKREEGEEGGRRREELASRASPRSSRAKQGAKRPAKSRDLGSSNPRPSRNAKPSAPRRPSAKLAGNVVAQLEQIEREQDGDGTVELDTGTIEVTSLGKVFFHDTKQTKGDLMRYYARLSPYLLPAIEGRPLVMRRFPNGIKGQAFYQQKAPPNPPPSVRVETVTDEGIETQDRLVGGNLATLLYVVQLGAISIDPWHSRTASIEYADYSIIDLDPGPKATFARVIDVARWVKEKLDELGLHAIPKTSGASGMHVVIPLADRISNDSARMVAELVATTVAEKHAKEATILRSVKSRPSSAVYIDFLQNIRGKTVAGVYSARARPGATVSTPLTWDEVRPGLEPRDFTISTVPGRLAEVGDLWGKGMRKRNSLRQLVNR